MYRFDKTKLKGCSTEEQLDCASRFIKSYYESKDILKLFEMCPDRCEYTDYKRTVSMAKYPSTSYIEKIVANGNLSILEQTVVNYRENQLALNIYFHELEYKNIIEFPVFTVLGVLSNIGGTLGIIIKYY